MNNKLFEEINRFKLLSGYDTKKTLSEQMMILSEQDKNWRVWSYNGVPICVTGPNGEFIPTAKGTELGYKTSTTTAPSYGIRQSPYTITTSIPLKKLSVGIILTVCVIELVDIIEYFILVIN